MIELLGKVQSTDRKRKLIIGGSIAGALVLLLAGFLLRDVFFKPDQNAQNKATAARVAKAVGELFVVPKEEPTVVKVEDKEKLKDQTFFNTTENGDYLLIYQNAKLAVIYRESVGKLVNTGPVNLPAQNTTPQGTAPAKQ